MAARRRGRYTHPDIVRAIQAAPHGTTPINILKQLTALKKKRDPSFPVGEPVPSKRTVQDIVAEHRRDDSARWQLADAAPEDIPLILPFVRYAASLDASFGDDKGSARGPITRGGDTTHATVTRAKAEWIVRIRRAAPDLPEPAVWDIVHYYLSRADDPEGRTFDLDLLLAFQPWQSEDSLREFAQALDHEDLPPQDKRIVLLVAASAAIWTEVGKPRALTRAAVQLMRGAREKEENDGKRTRKATRTKVGRGSSARSGRERKA